MARTPCRSGMACISEPSLNERERLRTVEHFERPAAREAVILDGLARVPARDVVHDDGGLCDLFPHHLEEPTALVVTRGAVTDNQGVLFARRVRIPPRGSTIDQRSVMHVQVG